MFIALSESGLSIHSKPAPSEITNALGSVRKVIFKSAALYDSVVSPVHALGAATVTVLVTSVAGLPAASLTL